MRMSRVGAVMVILGLIVSLQLFAANLEGDATAGEAVFAKKCAMCHGKDGTGNQKMAQMLKTEIRDLASAEAQGLSDEEIGKRITEGGDKMKPVKGMSEDEIANVIAFVRSLKK